MELTSILIPTHNSGAFIARAIESVINQSYPNIEIIIGDNASGDGTYEIAKSYATKNCTLRIYRNSENIGPVRNWLRCSALAQGKYAAFLFSDDWYEPSFIEKAVNYLEDPKIGFVYSSVKKISNEKTGQQGAEVLYHLSHTGIFPTRSFLERHLYLGSENVPLSPSCAVFRLGDLVDGLSLDIKDPHGIGYLQHGAGPDVLIYLLAAIRYKYFGYIQEPLVNFLAHGNNLSRRPEVNLAYALVKAWFAMRFKASAVIDLKRFRAAHLWRLTRLRKAGLYSSTLACDEDRWNIAWNDLILYLLLRMSNRLRSTIKNSFVL